MTNKPKVKFSQNDKPRNNKHLCNGTSGEVGKQTQFKPKKTQFSPSFFRVTPGNSLGWGVRTKKHKK
jgi:hypothetical protein